jgi:putative phosphoribosyl transferase
MIFRDRQDGGQQLAQALLKYRNFPDTVVLGLPRGGVVTAFEVAKALHLPLDITCPRKIGAPFNPEYAIGAITETGEGVFHDDLLARLGVSEQYIQQEVEKEKKQAQRRLSIFRKNRPKINLAGKTVIIVDDGLATGATMQAAIKSVKAEGAEKVVVAVPVAPSDTYEKIVNDVDEIIVLSTPSFFQAVGQFYQDFSQTEDEEVIKLLSLSHHPSE